MIGTSLLKVLSISCVYLSQAFMHQQSTLAIICEKTWADLELIGTMIEKDALPIKQVSTSNP